MTRVVNLHVTASCPIPSGSFGEYVATGDYEPPAINHSAILATDQPGQTIDGVPADVQSLALLANPPDLTQWLGVTLVPSSGSVDLLLLPKTSTCALNSSVGFDPAMVFAAVSSRTMIALGATDNVGLQPSFRVDLGTGRVSKMSPPIGTPRVRAGVAALGDGRALVTGGVNGSVIEQSIEIFDESIGGFAAPTCPKLQVERADHGAVTLANGDVLLAGGKSVTGPLLATERITFDGGACLTNQGTSAPLSTAHVDPTVIRLADGTVLVGGGFDKDGNPEPHVEFFSADATTPLGTVTLQVTKTNAFVALDGGGALFVDAGASPHAVFLSPKNGGTATPITPDVTAPLTDVKLFPRAGGGALLWTGSSWLAYDPWTGFASIADAPPNGPDASSPIAWSEPGMRAWVVPDGTVSVWRDSVRNAFATEGPYLVSDTSFMTPDRIPAPGFDALGPDDTIFVADARYRDVAIDVDGDGSALPHVVLRAPDRELDVGGADCPYVGSGAHVHVERNGAFVSFALGGPLTTCAAIATGARVAVGIRGAGAGVRARNLTVTRLSAALR